MKRLIMDLDGTLTTGETSDYVNVTPNMAVVKQLRIYREQGFEIVISTARNMRTYEGNVGKIAANTLPVIFEWLARHDIPYDEILVGKPWCGKEGFYVDDKSIRPDEFASLSYNEISDLLNLSKPDPTGG